MRGRRRVFGRCASDNTKDSERDFVIFFNDCKVAHAFSLEFQWSACYYHCTI